MTHPSDPFDALCARIAHLSPAEASALGKRLRLGPRCLALAVIENPAGKLLLDVGHDPVKGQSFYRLLGGGIEFGETGAAALQRELREELGAEVAVQEQLGALENLFAFAGVPGHEVVLIYRARFLDERFYARREVPVADTGRPATLAVWRNLEEAEAEGRPIYPAGLTALLTASRPPSGSR